MRFKILGRRKDYPPRREQLGPLQRSRRNSLRLHTHVIALLHRIAETIVLSELDLELWMMGTKLTDVLREKRRDDRRVATDAKRATQCPLGGMNRSLGLLDFRKYRDATLVELRTRIGNRQATRGALQ